jgi:anaerobic magnesium-protoporphyrin IX monomethyl ester cyclase
MRVYLISLSDKDFLKDGGDRPPLGILYIAGYLKKKGIKVAVCDLNHKSEKEMIDEINNFQPRIIGISFNTPLYYDALKLNKLIKDMFPGLITVAGGNHASALPESCEDFNYVVVGEGETGMMKVIEGVKNC